jgi:hypothetical protein
MSVRDKGSSGYGNAPYRNIVEKVNLLQDRRRERESNRGLPGSRYEKNSGKGFHNPGRGVGVDVNVAVGASEYKTRCYACGGLGQVARNFKISNEGYKAIGNQGNDVQVQKSSHSANQC